MPKPLKGVGYDLNSTNNGFSLNIHINEQEEGNIQPLLKLNPFDCFIDKVVIPNTDPVEYKHRLKIVKGVCPAFIIQGFTDESPDGAKTMIQDIYKVNIYPTGSKVTGESADSVFMEDGGYLKLTPDTNYMLFAFILQPGYVDAPDEYRAIQLVLSEIGIGKPNNIIDTLLSYCFFYGGVEEEVGMLYSQDWCIRDNIAQFVWNETSERFQIFQYTNAPKLFYPVFNKTGTGAGDTYTAPMVAAFTGYTKDLETVPALYTPSTQDQFPPLHS
jgi:hypothetical protein